MQESGWALSFALGDWGCCFHSLLSCLCPCCLMSCILQPQTKTGRGPDHGTLHSSATEPGICSLLRGHWVQEMTCHRNDTSSGNPPQWCASSQWASGWFMPPRDRVFFLLTKILWRFESCSEAAEPWAGDGWWLLLLTGDFFSCLVQCWAEIRTGQDHGAHSSSAIQLGNCSLLQGHYPKLRLQKSGRAQELLLVMEGSCSIVCCPAFDIHRPRQGAAQTMVPSHPLHLLLLRQRFQLLCTKPFG